MSKGHEINGRGMVHIEERCGGGRVESALLFTIIKMLTHTIRYDGSLRLEIRVIY